MGTISSLIRLAAMFPRIRLRDSRSSKTHERARKSLAARIRDA